MSGFNIRTSKFRHVFCDQPKPEKCWTDLRISTSTGDQQYIKASAKYFSLGLAGGGGPMMIGRLDRPGRFSPGVSAIFSGHSGAVLDMDWNPHNDDMFASASEDCLIKIWQVPDDWEPTDENGDAKEGKEHKDALATLEAHRKKVTLLRYHPTAANTLLSTSADHTVKVWDVENSAPVTSFDDFSDLVHDVVWDAKGEQCAFSCKDKKLRIADPRTGAVTTTIETVHGGSKSVKIVFATEKLMYTVGANKQSSREIRVWDLKNTAKPIHAENIDTAAGALLPLWDCDTNVLYLCGKGDGVVRLFEYEDKSPFLYKLNDGFRSNIPGKGYCMVPKRGLNVMQNETARILKVTTDTGIHPLSFTVPRKSDMFQDDIFPDAPAAVPSHTHEQWFGGSAKSPVTISLDPKDGAVAAAGAKPKTKFKSASSVGKELEVAKKRIAELELLLKSNGVSF
jgi:coronin-1B/1C/6